MLRANNPRILLKCRDGFEISVSRSLIRLSPLLEAKVRERRNNEPVDVLIPSSVILRVLNWMECYLAETVSMDIPPNHGSLVCQPLKDYDHDVCMGSFLMRFTLKLCGEYLKIRRLHLVAKTLMEDTAGYYTPRRVLGILDGLSDEQIAELQPLLDHLENDPL